MKELLRIHLEKVIYIVDVIEFQKRRFPHAYIIVHVHPELPIDQIDKIILAELPHEKSRLRKLVEKYMIHNKQHSSCCLQNNKCIYQYLKPITPETYINEKGFVQYRCRTQDDLWIVPYNPILISKLECHINFEVASTVHLFMYLYKYLFKGPDYIKFTINNTPNTIPENPDQHNTKTTNINPTISQRINEFEDYINGRYLSVPEAAWRIFR